MVQPKQNVVSTKIIVHGGTIIHAAASEVKGCPIPIPRDSSPLVLKVLAYLKYRHLDYVHQTVFEHKMEGNPGRQLPVVHIKWKELHNSDTIINEIEKKTRRDPSSRIGHGVTEADAAQGNTISLLCEEMLPKYISAVRFQKEHLLKTRKALALRQHMPWFAARKLWKGMKRDAKRSQRSNGISEATRTYCKAQITRFLDTLETVLQERPLGITYISGTNRPSAADFTLYGFLSIMVFDAYYYGGDEKYNESWNPWATQLLHRPEIIGYVKALEEGFFGVGGSGGKISITFSAPEEEDKVRNSFRASAVKEKFQKKKPAFLTLESLHSLATSGDDLVAAANRQYKNMVSADDVNLIPS